MYGSLGCHEFFGEPTLNLTSERRILGLDPGLTYTGWAVISVHHLDRFVCEACGRIQTSAQQSVAVRLVHIHDALLRVCQAWSPHAAAIEQIFVNSNPASALKLGLARGVVLMTPASCGIPVTEYSANTVKKSVTGNGHASKVQVLQMLKGIFNMTPSSYDSSDALAVALCHRFHQK
ncbi:crossover junction endodeoxyribonuclease RuvC [Holospora curviuscula]|uniref:Crossover junction endodeoxyribonuclease RuvC n=1 Tax=Holospora curviuscula TaxID=1082868 RepID=A0A2S5RAK3_9PROT|nr:crossover junction endodeoxyribonuclease RuvC [Holospora curviuscula]PPE04222.1 Crossover junction endodeoxyribonuclease RuvC [Holospora curviuscula]